MALTVNSKSYVHLVPIPSVVYNIFADKVNSNTNNLLDLLDSLSKVEIRSLTMAMKVQGIKNLGNTMSLIEFINAHRNLAGIPVQVNDMVPSGDTAPFRNEFRLLCQNHCPQNYDKPVSLVSLSEEKGDDLVDVKGLVLYAPSLELDEEKMLLAIAEELLDNKVDPISISKILKSGMFRISGLLANQ